MKASIKALLAGAVVATTSACATISESDTLSIETFNPGTNSIFAVSSSLIEGPTEVILVDAQFQRNDAQTVVDMINATGKQLTTIFISHGDPDFYFGLDVITAAFPDAKVLSTPSTRDYIKASMEPKKDHWGPILGDNAPQYLVLPDSLEGDTLKVDGQSVKVTGLDGHDPAHTFLWVPSAKTVLGGIPVFDNMHAWMADSPTPESRQNWLQTLDLMSELQPETVIPGHYLPDSSKDVNSIAFIRQYVEDFTSAQNQATDSQALIATMKTSYPNIGGDALLDLSAKVATGEMQWP